MNYQLPFPLRRRRCPGQFSWVDQRLARERYFERASADAWLLYLFLLTVADAQGGSYYGERSLCVRLGLKLARLAQARRELIELDLLSYRAPVYQVLSLPDRVTSTSSSAAQAREHLQRLRSALNER